MLKSSRRSASMRRPHGHAAQTRMNKTEDCLETQIAVKYLLCNLFGNLHKNNYNKTNIRQICWTMKLVEQWINLLNNEISWTMKFVEQWNLLNNEICWTMKFVEQYNMSIMSYSMYTIHTHMHPHAFLRATP